MKRCGRYNQLVVTRKVDVAREVGGHVFVAALPARFSI